MKIVEKRDFKTSVSALWNIIHEPSNMPAWNTKCTYCENTNGGASGSKFEATIVMNGRSHPVLGLVVESIPEKRIIIQHQPKDLPEWGITVETLEILQKQNGRVHLVRTIDFSQTQLSKIVKCLIWFLNKFGRPTNGPPLSALDDLL